MIVPWNDPLRVAERIVMLDHLSSGRAVLGLGRGLARVEYESFGIEMGESRARFDEAARMILAAVETGFIEGDGPYYPQLRTEIRPRPLRSFRDRALLRRHVARFGRAGRRARRAADDVLAAAVGAVREGRRSRATAQAFSRSPRERAAAAAHR